MQITLIPAHDGRDPRFRPLDAEGGRDASLVGLPELFGDYTLVRRIGRGGWGTVYEAHRKATSIGGNAQPERGPNGLVFPGGSIQGPEPEPSSLELQRVALKRLEPLSTDGARRIVREARLLQLLESPRIVRLLDHGSVSGVPYLSLELVEGVDLATLLFRLRMRRQLLPTEMLLELLLQVGLALRVAHTWLDPQQKRPTPLLHGDLKPSNVLVGLDGRVRLTDFGSAQRSGIREEGLEFPGTPGYVSPEWLSLQQSLPNTRPLTTASDLFALGLIGFELTTLTPLFTGSASQMLQQLIQAEQFIPMALTRLPPELHPRLSAVITRLLAPEPDQRLGHIDDALRPLQELQSQLQLKADIASFIVPYLQPAPGERQEARVTPGNLMGNLPGDSLGAGATMMGGSDSSMATITGVAYPGQGYPGQGYSGLAWGMGGPRVTQLTRAQLDALVPTTRRAPLTVAGVAAVQHRRNRELVLRGLLVVLLCILGAGFLLWSLPHRLEVRSTPANALVSLQPGCEGAWSAAELTPAELRTKGPWPMCVAVEAPTHVRTIARVLEPAFLNRFSVLTVSLDKEVCLKVGSRPPGLEVFVDNRPRGVTGLDDLRICGLTPFEPYEVQMRYSGVRWDIQEVVGKPGETVSVFQDFSVRDVVTASPYERCVRYFDAGELERAIEICRVAVVQAPSLEQALDALIIQGRAYAAQDDAETACDLFGVAMDRAVDARLLSLERRVVDVRRELDCEAVETARALREQAEADGSPVPEEEEGESKPSGSGTSSGGASGSGGSTPKSNATSRASSTLPVPDSAGGVPADVAAGLVPASKAKASAGAKSP